MRRSRGLFDLTGQWPGTALSGLGVRLAEVLARTARWALVARRATTGEVKARIDGRRPRDQVAADVGDRDAMRRAFDAAEQAFGPVTILLNNAGVAHADRVVDLAESEWRRVLATNLDAVFFWAQEAARRLLAAGKPGAIINLASVLGFGVAGRRSLAVSKAAVGQLTQCAVASVQRRAREAIAHG